MEGLHLAEDLHWIPSPRPLLELPRGTLEGGGEWGVEEGRMEGWRRGGGVGKKGGMGKNGSQDLGEV